MPIEAVWGPRVGYAGTGSFQSAVGLIDFATTDDNLETTSFTATAITFQGFVDGALVTVQLVGSGFSVDTSGEVRPVGMISSIDFYAGGSAVASEQLISFDFAISVAELLTAIDQDNDGIVPEALEDLFTQQDWT
ncbi:hypothetical protein [Sulfitobacter aestuariivivens]|uniref:Uncharacterized protein n=1 Tax=Sulfitobacter aestuariivivens TaxID=2766981 RepID=A0A927HG36_9RHOB|nr:hypothetical protein [Sulfitobacter aestuariivivens]MBD3665064.1 hypothetical protein [Sulfitobacter aestuariivivens]